MRPQMIMFFVFALIVGNMLCLIIDGNWLGAEDQTQMESLVGHDIRQADGIPVITPIVNFGIMFWRSISWDFSFLGGDLAWIRWLLFALTAGAVFAIGIEFRSTITSIFGRR